MILTVKTIIWNSYFTTSNIYKSGLNSVNFTLLLYLNKTSDIIFIAMHSTTCLLKRNSQASKIISNSKIDSIQFLLIDNKEAVLGKLHEHTNYAN
jgi:hypothetical protein